MVLPRCICYNISALFGLHGAACLSRSLHRQEALRGTLQEMIEEETHPLLNPPNHAWHEKADDSRRTERVSYHELGVWELRQDTFCEFRAGCGRPCLGFAGSERDRFNSTGMSSAPELYRRIEAATARQLSCAMGFALSYYCYQYLIIATCIL